MESNQITGVIAALSALAGGAGLKAIERFFRHKEKAADDMGTFRREILEECKRLRIEVAEWRAKYYDIMSQYIELEKRQAIIEIEMVSLREQMAKMGSQGAR